MLFDLGNTLAYYFETQEFPCILKQAIMEVQNYLLQRNLFHVSSDEMWRRVKEEDYEVSNYRVRPLENRLLKIFQFNNATGNSNLIMDMCRCFMKPIFERSHCYEDTPSTLKKLNESGFKTAIVSNTTWGSPANLWRQHIASLGLTEYMNALVFCRDVGWRKPAKQIFEYALEKLQVSAQNCIFVGDDPRWDQVGPMSVGIESIIIDRKGTAHQVKGASLISNLHELIERLRLR